VVVTTPDDAHVEIVTEAAWVGKHIVVEKPIDNDLAQAVAIERPCREAVSSLRLLLSVPRGPCVLANSAQQRTPQQRRRHWLPRWDRKRRYNSLGSIRSRDVSPF